MLELVNQIDLLKAILVLAIRTGLQKLMLEPTILIGSQKAKLELVNQIGLLKRTL